MTADFSHRKPPEVFEKEGYQTHKIEIKENNERIGYVEFEYYNHPFPFYYVSYVLVKDELRGRGIGRKLLEKIDNFLDTAGRAGILLNNISKSSPARDMYENHGWAPIPGKDDWLTYNLPSDLEDGRLEKAIHKIESNNLS